MKGLTWVGAFVAIGIAAGAVVFALTPARYRAVTRLELRTVRDASDPVELFERVLDAQVEDTIRKVLHESRMAVFMEEFDLFTEERRAGRTADALLGLRKSTSIFRRPGGSPTTQQLEIAFEAGSPAVAQRVSYEITSLIKAETDSRNGTIEMVASGLFHDLETQLGESERAMKGWLEQHGNKPAPAAMARHHAALTASFDEFMDGAEGVIGWHDHSRLPLHLDLVLTELPKAPQRSVSPRFLPFAGAGAAAGLFIGLFTMPPFIWWRRHTP